MSSFLIGKQTKLPNPETTLSQFFEDFLEKNHLENKIGVIDPQTNLTFGKLNSIANQIARVLIEKLRGVVSKQENYLPVLVAVRFEPGREQI